MKKLISTYQNYLPVLALILTSIAISIRSKDGGVKLVLGEYPAIIFVFIFLSSILMGIYFRLKDQKLSELTNQIKSLSELDPDVMKERLDSLTERQREVYELIVSGKTNKEIMSAIFIEQSTLKSHINQIYKKLNVKSRRELKSNSNN